MATINYSLKSKKNPTRIYCRFLNGRYVDIVCPLDLFIDPKNWDKSNQKIRNVIEVRNRDEINRRLALLKIHIFDSFNLDYSTGEIIDRTWLNGVIANFFKRPKGEDRAVNQNNKVYYTDFSEWWLKEKSPTWLVDASGFMTSREKNKYQAFLEMVKDFQGNSKIKIRSANYDTITKFVEYLNNNSYASATIKRHVGRFKFFLNRAEQENLTVDSTFKQRVFIPKPIEIKEPYLTPEEIAKIYNKDFSKNEILDNVRDNLIIACWTGLRVSDFLTTLNIDNFIDDFIEIKTQKTKTSVVIPIHPNVKRILIKRNGQLPKKISDQKFNEYVKDVCKLSGIKDEIQGKLYNSKIKRKVLGKYPKYKLVSSHIGRRSFATNHYGKIANSVIMSVCGWSSEEMMLKYIKKSNREHAVELQKYWEKTYG